jgi:alkyl sulfatase BDS1-like metallo-beta-lactamase superfamily hydrolase
VARPCADSTDGTVPCARQSPPPRPALLTRLRQNSDISLAPTSGAQHHWPTFGKEEVKKLLKSQRDLYRDINDETLRPVNHGYIRDEIV